jgi:hypothetical protein
MQFLYTAGVLFSCSRSAFVTNLLAYFYFLDEARHRMKAREIDGTVQGG